ncbi:MAG: GDSL-type esterase/lipase family protein [Arachnia sp.]
MTVDVSKLQHWPQPGSLDPVVSNIKAHAYTLMAHAQHVQVIYRGMEGHYETSHTAEFLAGMDVVDLQMTEVEAMGRGMAGALEDFADALRGLEPERSYCLEQVSRLTAQMSASGDMNQELTPELEHTWQRLLAREQELQGEVDRVTARFAAAIEEFQATLGRISYSGPVNNVGSAGAGTSERRSVRSLAEQYEGMEVISLGDSTVSAETLSPPDSPTNTKGNYCHRSDIGVGVQLAGLMGVNSVNVACSGSASEHLTQYNQQNSEAAQLEQAFPAKTYDEGVVYLRTGANDAHFAAVLSDLVMNVDGTSTENAKKAQEVINQDLQSNIREAIAEIQDRAPNKTIVVAGYGTMFTQPNPGSAEGMREQDYIHDDIQVGADLVEGSLGDMTVEEQAWMNQRTIEANAAIRAAAEESGVIYYDPNQAYEGHRIGDDEPHVNELAWDFDQSNYPGNVPVSMGSFHYTEAGYKAEADEVLEILRDR